MHLSIDTASDEPAVALSVDGSVTKLHAWTSEQNQSRELLPNIDAILRDAGVAKDDLRAVFVDTGPGGYAGLRVGVSTAKALAHGLGIALVGIGRLELDACTVARAAAGRRIVAVHRAGRGELAWAVYRDAAGWREEASPRIGPLDELCAVLTAGDALVGEVDAALAERAAASGATLLPAHGHRVVALAALGARRIADGRTDDPRALVPLYLRGPAITTPKRA
jgi:tRNA threonylcarbamoyladenosine biosynthesis protein TsaB